MKYRLLIVVYDCGSETSSAIMKEFRSKRERAQVVRQLQELNVKTGLIEVKAYEL